MDRETYELASLWIGLIIAVLAAIGTLITVLVNARKTTVETENMKIKQSEIHDGQQQVLAQFQNNGGSTMKDATDKLERMLGEVRSDLRGVRADMGRLSNVDMEDRQRAAEEHKRIYDTIYAVQADVSDHIAQVPDILTKHQEETMKLIEEKLNEAS